MHVIQLFNFNGQEVLDSRDVANMIGKLHAHLNRDIREIFQPIQNWIR